MPPHWENQNSSSDCSASPPANVVRKPVAYVSGKKAEVSAVFTSNCPVARYIKGVGPEGIEFIHDNIIQPVGTTFYFPKTKANIPFVQDKVKHWEEFKIMWFFSFDGQNWEEVGESNNEMYVTHKVPVINRAVALRLIADPTSPDPTNPFFIPQDYDGIYHTVLEIGCEAAAEETQDSTIVTEIFKDFKDRQVYKADESGPMKYWGDDNPLEAYCRRVHGLLQFSDANCGEWAELLQNVFSAQGIQDVRTVRLDRPQPSFPGSLVPVGSTQTAQERAFNQMRQLLPDNTIFRVPPLPGGFSPEQFFLVKKWNVPISGTPVCYLSDRFNRENGLANPSVYNSDVTLSNGNQLKYYELTGSPGQSMSNPVSEFVNHAMVYYKNKFYDPSYGIGPFSSEQAYESEAIYGRAVLVFATIPISTPMGNMDKNILVLYHLAHEQPSTIDLLFTINP